MPARQRVIIRVRGASQLCLARLAETLMLWSLPRSVVEPWSVCYRDAWYAIAENTCALPRAFVPRLG